MQLAAVYLEHLKSEERRVLEAAYGAPFAPDSAPFSVDALSTRTQLSAPELFAYTSSSAASGPRNGNGGASVKGVGGGSSTSLPAPGASVSAGSSPGGTSQFPAAAGAKQIAVATSPSSPATASTTSAPTSIAEAAIAKLPSLALEGRTRESLVSLLVPSKEWATRVRGSDLHTSKVLSKHLLESIDEDEVMANDMVKSTLSSFEYTVSNSS